MTRNSSLIRKCLAIVGLSLLASTASAALTPVGKLSYLVFNGNNITVSMTAPDSSQITSDPGLCGEDKKFVLLATHANYEALAGVLLTYYYEGREDIALDLSGCSGTSPAISQINAG